MFQGSDATSPRTLTFYMIFHFLLLLRSLTNQLFLKLLYLPEKCTKDSTLITPSGIVVCVCVHMCVYMYISIYVCAHVSCVCVCVHVCVCVCNYDVSGSSIYLNTCILLYATIEYTLVSLYLRHMLMQMQYS